MVAGVRQPQNEMMQMLTKMMERLDCLDHLESERATPPPRRSTGACQQRQTGAPPRRDNQNPRKPVVCHKCGKEGHFARGCAARRSQPPGTLGAKGRACEGNPIQASPEHLNNFIVNVNAAMSSFFIQGRLFKHPMSFLVDTGSPVSLLQSKVWNLLKPPGTVLSPWGGNKLAGVNGTDLHCRGSFDVTITIMSKTFLLTMLIIDNLAVDAILGLDFLEANHCTLNIGDRLLQIPACKSQIPLNTHEHCRKHTPVYAILADTVQVPAYSELEVMVSIPDTNIGTSCVLEATDSKATVMVARALVVPTNEITPIRLLNPYSEPTTIYKGCKIATLEEVDPVIPISAVTDKSSRTTTPDLNDALWDIVSRSATKLDDIQQQDLYKLLQQYRDVFAADKHDLGYTNALKHQINTGDAPPIRQRARRVPPARRQEAKNLLNDMLNNNIIQPSSSPWASPVVLVQKKDGSLRFCIDYRKVNAVTRKDAYPLPRVDDSLDTLACCKWFTTLDLLSGYWQVEVAEKDREKTAFITQEGLFEFTKMPFGLCNAPATFQQLMDLILAGLQWKNCLVYLDDILIIGKTFKEHNDNLGLVFSRLREAGLKLQSVLCAKSR